MKDLEERAIFGKAGFYRGLIAGMLLSVTLFSGKIIRGCDYERLKTENTSLKQSLKIEQITTSSRNICEYLDLDRNGVYESFREIREYNVKPDTSNVYPIKFATQFDGYVKNRECSKEELENMFNLYGYPNASEIRFAK